MSLRPCRRPSTASDQGPPGSTTPIVAGSAAAAGNPRAKRTAAMIKLVIFFFIFFLLLPTAYCLMPVSFDHLVRPRQQVGRDHKADLLRRLEIYDQIEF